MRSLKKSLEEIKWARKYLDLDARQLKTLDDKQRYIERKIAEETNEK
jgi:hypothetical protein